MKFLNTTVRRPLTAVVFVVAVPLVAWVFVSRSQSAEQLQTPSTITKPSGSTNQIALLQAEINQLKAKLPDQSHAMADVGYHFANLWFAGEKKNWPLAKFYFEETRSHLRWAVRIIPVRKSPAGNDLDMKGILDGVDNGIFSELGKAIEARDSAQFVHFYKQSLEGCYACHKASGKPYLRPQIPLSPPQTIINFDPDAKWPE
jgi:hypothetical protein